MDIHRHRRCLSPYLKLWGLARWNELRRAYESWSRVVQANGDLRALFLAEARQNIHRVNLFADVVWALLGLILSALGTIGLCVLQKKQ